MNVFLSCSGRESRQIAEKFREWLPELTQGVKGWTSNKDILPGTMWAHEIHENLKECAYGIVFLTPQNIKEPWILFEAGALHVATATDRVTPFLCGLKPEDINSTPLSQFQYTLPTRDSVQNLILTLNDIKQHNKEEKEVLLRRFDKIWPEIDVELDAYRTSQSAEFEIHDSISGGLTSFFKALNPIKDLSIYALNTQTITTVLESRPELKIQNIRVIMASEEAIYKLYSSSNQNIATCSTAAISSIADGRVSSLNIWKERRKGLSENIEIRYLDVFPSQYTLIADKALALTGLYRFEKSKRRHGLLPGEPMLADRNHSNGFVMHLSQWFDELWERSFE